MADKMAAGSAKPSSSWGTTGSDESTERTVRPLFVKVRDLPCSEDHEYSVSELCRACEKVSGIQSMEGAQRIGGLWRLYPSHMQARAQLLVSGLALRGVQVQLSNTNPFLLKGNNGQEIATTRLLISDIPLSYTNVEIEEALVKLGCQLMSAIKYECDRDEHGRLTRWKTGRRFVFIAVPKDALPRELKIGIFRAKLYHREQRSALQKENSVCFNCLDKGHFSYACPNEVRCRLCMQFGHKQGSPQCGLVFESTEASSETTPGQTDQAGAVVSEEAAPVQAVESQAGQASEEAEVMAAHTPASADHGDSDQLSDQLSDNGDLVTKKKERKKKGQRNILQMFTLKRPSSPEDAGEKKIRKDSEQPEGSMDQT